MKTAQRWLQLLILAWVGIVCIHAPARADEQPPYNVTDPAISENFRNIYLQSDRLSLLSTLFSYTLTTSSNSFCIDSPTFCVDATNNQILADNGSVSNVSYGFTGNPGTGMYRRTTNVLNFAINGTRVAEWDTSYLNMLTAITPNDNTQTLDLGDTSHLWRTLYISTVNANFGSASYPSYSFFGDSRTGLYRVASNSVGFSQGGTLTWALDSGGYWRSQGTYGIQAGFGSVSTPSFGFVSDEDTGIYRAAANDMGLVAGGSLSVEVTPSKVIMGTTTLVADGTAAIPGLAFGNDQDTGMYRLGTNSLALSANGTLSFVADANDVTVTSGHKFNIQDGTPAAPGLRFDNDPDTGFFRNGSNNVSFAVGGSTVIDVTSGHTQLIAGTANGTTYNPLFVKGGTVNNVLATQTTTGVTTTGSYIIGITDGFCLVNGNNGGGGAYFRDLITCSYNAACTVLNSATASGAPAARTYASDGTGIKLTMASSTYNVNVFCMDMGRN